MTLKVSWVYVQCFARLAEYPSSAARNESCEAQAKRCFLYRRQVFLCECDRSVPGLGMIMSKMLHTSSVHASQPLPLGIAVMGSTGGGVHTNVWPCRNMHVGGTTSPLASLISVGETLRMRIGIESSSLIFTNDPLASKSLDVTYSDGSVSCRETGRVFIYVRGSGTYPTRAGDRHATVRSAARPSCLVEARDQSCMVGNKWSDFSTRPSPFLS